MNDVIFSGGTEGLQSEDLASFFVGWPRPPSLDDRLEILSSADEVVVCRTPDGAVVGFATAITDYRFAACIPLVEVLTEHQCRGISSQMVDNLNASIHLRALLTDVFLVDEVLKTQVLAAKA